MDDSGEVPNRGAGPEESRSKEGWDEEAWESDIQQLLADLPMVDPPEGFIAQAIDHRPIFAGRSMVLAALVSVLALALISTTDLFAEETLVPNLEALVSRHSATEAGLLGTVIPTGSDDGTEYVFELLDAGDAGDRSGVVLPTEFEWEASFQVERLRQLVFANGDGAVSVFQEPGQVNFGDLPSEGLTDIEGVVAWSDPSRAVVVFQMPDSAVIIIGLSPNLLPQVASTMEAGSELSLLERLGRKLNRVTSEFGFPDLDG